MPAESVYLVWSNEHGAWWGPAFVGYTRALDAAGRYSRRQAIEICKQANIAYAPGDIPQEIPILETDALEALPAFDAG